MAARRRSKDARQAPVNSRAWRKAQRRRRREQRTNATVLARRAKRRRVVARVGRVLLVLLALFALVAPPLLVASPISYVPLVMAVLLVLASWVYLRVLSRSLTVGVAQMETSCERGSDAGLAVSLVNSSVLPYPRIELQFFVTDLFGGYDASRSLSCALGPREATEVSFDVRFAHLGTYEAGIEGVTIHDLLGLFSTHRAEGMRRQVTVRPRRVDVSGADGSQTAPDESRNMLKPIAADDMDYAIVREYHYGDPMKTVHWNLSARSPDGTMYTRLYETYVNPALAIIVDPYAPNWEADELTCLFDGMVEGAVGLALMAREIGIETEVRYVDRDHEPAVARLASTLDADDMVRCMLRITCADDARVYAGEPEAMLRAAGLASHGFGNVAFVTSRPDSGFCSVLVDVHMRRRNALALVAVPRALEGPDREKFLAPLRQLLAAGVPYYVVESTEASTEVIGL